jgi:hypothetical protein
MRWRRSSCSMVLPHEFDFGFRALAGGDLFIDR